MAKARIEEEKKAIAAARKVGWDVRYLNEVRIDRVKELLIHSSLSLKEIAPICGFNNEYYLSTVFRQLLGVVPGRYRRNLPSKKQRTVNLRGPDVKWEMDRASRSSRDY